VSLAVEDVTACLVTRGDQPEMMRRIEESLIFPHVVVWNNSMSVDRKVAGRYYAISHAYTTAVYFQDDDVIVPAETQRRLLAAYEPGAMVANWGHGDEPAGYDDLPLVCAGAIVDRDLPWNALHRYLKQWPEDEAFLYEADFVAGVLYPSFSHLHLPFEINYEVAQHPSRLVNQPWQRELKFEITNRARRIRDNDLDREYTDWYAGREAFA
jgi:hypothetical protein